MPVAKYEIILVVADAGAAHDAIKAKKIEPSEPLETTSWGARRFVLLDPDETPVVFMEMAEVSPQDWSRTDRTLVRY
jgi:hypothetical protein